MILISGSDLRKLKGDMESIAENQRYMANSAEILADVSRTNMKLIIGLLLTCAALMFIVFRQRASMRLF